MKAKDPKDVARRKVVTERLRRFSAELTVQTATGTAEIWASIERRLAHNPSAPPTPTMQQQPSNRSPRATSRPL
jgi:hypothetical protein